jgi:DNA-directed RNA polymerase specialized sigma subunit
MIFLKPWIKKLFIFRLIINNLKSIKDFDMYVDRNEMTLEVKKSLDQDKLTDKMVEMLMRIAKEISKKLRYRDETQRDDCVQQGLYNALRYWRNFKPELPNANAFSYFTQLIKIGMCQGFKMLNDPKKFTGTYKVQIDENIFNDSNFN